MSPFDCFTSELDVFVEESCDDPDPPVNGFIQCTEIGAKKRCTAFCESGHHFLWPTSSIITCGATGVFTKIHPECLSVLPPCGGMYYKHDSYSWKDTLKYYCYFEICAMGGLSSVSVCPSPNLSVSLKYGFQSILSSSSLQPIVDSLNAKIEGIKNELCSPPCSSYTVHLEDVLEDSVKVLITVPGVL